MLGNPSDDIIAQPGRCQTLWPCKYHRPQRTWSLAPFIEVKFLQTHQNCYAMHTCLTSFQSFQLTKVGKSEMQTTVWSECIGMDLTEVLSSWWHHCYLNRHLVNFVEIQISLHRENYKEYFCAFTLSFQVFLHYILSSDHISEIYEKTKHHGQLVNTLLVSYSRGTGLKSW